MTYVQMLNESDKAADDLFLMYFKKGDYSGCKTALRLGANPDIVIEYDKLDHPNYIPGKGMTALHALIIMYPITWTDEHHEVHHLFKLLIKRGANVNAQDERLETPLHIAIRESAEMELKELLNAGANPNIKNASGLAPIDLLQDLEPMKIKTAWSKKINSWYTMAIKELIDHGAEWQHKFTQEDLVELFEDDPNWLWKHLPPGEIRNEIRRSSKSKNLFGI